MRFPTIQAFRDVLRLGFVKKDRRHISVCDILESNNGLERVDHKRIYKKENNGTPATIVTAGNFCMPFCQDGIDCVQTTENASIRHKSRQDDRNRVQMTVDFFPAGL